jgi:Putative restriction endonuclease
MPTIPAMLSTRDIQYPTSDGQPIAETDLHPTLMNALIVSLQKWFAGNKRVYVSGNLLVYFEEGNKHRHLSPDVFLVRGVANKLRKHFLTWEEDTGKWLPTLAEVEIESERKLTQASNARKRERDSRRKAEQERDRESAAGKQAEEELHRLRDLLAIQGKLPPF